MELAFLAALFIGVTLGLLGSGGSILTVPVLIFILQRPEKLAIAESLAIVGCIALGGAIPYAMRTQIHWHSVIFFGLPGMLGACIGGNCSYYITGTLQLTLFALVMVIAAGVMLFGPLSVEKLHPPKHFISLMILEGFFLGCLTGFIGIGGGFLIVPALVILNNLSMSLAIGTSLIIIAMNALTGFMQQLFSLHTLYLHVDWKNILLISIIGVVGSLIGSAIGKKISEILLRRIFGLGICGIGCYILFSQ